MKKKPKLNKNLSFVSKKLFFLKKYNKLLPLLLIFILVATICVTYLYFIINNSKKEVWYSTDSFVTVAPKDKLLETSTSVPLITNPTLNPTSTPIPLPQSLLAKEMYSVSDYLKTKDIEVGKLDPKSIGFLPWTENGNFLLLNSYNLSLENIKDELVLKDLVKKYFFSKNFYQNDQKFYSIINGSMVIDSILSFFKENIRCSINTTLFPVIYCGDVNNKASDNLTILYHDLLSDHFPVHFTVIYMDDQYFFGGWDTAHQYAKKINNKWVLQLSTQNAWDCQMLYDDGVKPEIFNNAGFDKIGNECLDYSDKSENMFYGQYSDFYKKIKNGK